jgi:hypothetical protein
VRVSPELDTRYARFVSIPVQAIASRKGYVAAWTLPDRQHRATFAYRRVDDAGRPAGPVRSTNLDAQAHQYVAIAQGSPSNLRHSGRAGTRGQVYLSPID